jgi:hypothetical protein
MTRNQPKNICADASVARFAGSAFLFKRFLGFRSASPQALCFRLLRRLWSTNYFFGPVSELSSANYFVSELFLINRNSPKVNIRRQAVPMIE